LAVFKMPRVMKIGCPVLRVRNIDTVLAFYEKSLGPQVWYNSRRKKSYER